MSKLLKIGLMFTLAFAVSACGEKAEQPAAKPEAAKEKTSGEQKAPETQKAALKTDKGVDAAKKVIKVGILNDESGPAAVIGKAFGAGKKILAAQVNAGDSGVLPKGWTVELLSKDHAYNPAKAQQGFDAIKNDSLFLGLSFGTPTTLPLRPFLERDKMVAYPASLSSLMAANQFTPPAGPSYMVEAARGMDWVVESAGGADKVKAAVIYQQDDYGKDGVAGWTAAAKLHGVTMVAERAVKPGQKDMTAEITALKNGGVTHVFLAVLPSSTGPILGTAAAMKYMPVWVGATATWLDVFFAHPKLPAAVFANFHWVTGFPYWGEKVPGMDTFLKAFKDHGKGARPDFYLLMSYVQGLLSLEVAKRAIESGDITREGYLNALKGIKNWNAGGLVQPIDMSALPYSVSTKTRVLKPDFEKKTWTVVADYAAPKKSK